MDKFESNKFLDLSSVIDFFEALEVKTPDVLNLESLTNFKLEQETRWAIALADFQKLRTVWAKEQLRLDQLLVAREIKHKAISAQEKIVTGVRAQFDSAFQSLMKARAAEEVARALPYADKPEAARFVARQLQIAKNYLSLS